MFRSSTMRLALVAAVISIALMPQVSGAVQDPGVQTGPKLKLTFEEGGFVTLVSNGANVREILAEWTRQGGSTFVNSDRLVGTPLTLQFTHQPEKDVMASLLRQAAGYVLGPRRAGTVGASSFEVVYILPTSNPQAGGYTPAPAAPYQQPQYSQVGSPMTRSRQSAEALRRHSRRPAHRRHPDRSPRLDISRQQRLAAASRFQ
jgi:hypothetical protein